MPDGLTITYKGNTLHSSTEDDTFTLNTSGKYMEDNITISATNVSSLDVTYNNSSLVSETSATGTWTLNTAGKLMEDDVSFDVVVTPPDPFVTFSSPNSFTLQTYKNTKNWDGTLEYSVDKTNWSTWDGTTTLSSVNNVIYFRGVGNTQICSSDASTTTYTASTWVITGSNVSMAGNIDNLLDYTVVANRESPSMTRYAFNYLFKSCTALVSAPQFPQRTLSEYCYRGMFYGCTSLVSAPALPSVSIADSCYDSMFLGCSNLQTSPTVLPATTLAAGCYRCMFAKCTSLLTTPIIPASVLIGNSCSQIFEACTSLTDNIDMRHVTEVGATILEGSGTMAVGCNIAVLFDTSLVSLAENAFAGVFSNSQTFRTYYYFTDNDTVSFTAANVVSGGGSKSPYTHYIYTDNTAIKDAALAKVGQYTTVNVYHLDGSDW